MKNIDKLRKLKPKKLAKLLGEIAMCEKKCPCCVFDKNCEEEKYYKGKCYDGTLQWLKQEVKK